MYNFRWNQWNIEHIGEHGVSPSEAEYVANHSRIRKIEHDKYIAIGQTAAGEYIQVIFVIDDESPKCVFVIHARPLNPAEKRAFRRKK